MLLIPSLDSMAEEAVNPSIREEIAKRYYADLSKENADPSTLKENIAKEIRSRVSNTLSLRQIKAFASQVTIHIRNKILKPLGISDEELHPDKFPFARLCVEKADITDANQIEVLAAQLRVSKEIIKKIADVTHEMILEALDLPSDISTGPVVNSEVIPVPVAAEDKVQVISAVTTPSSRDPEDEDYNNEIKIVWRKKWQDYIEACTTPEQRRKMKVLCLPGKECFEIPLYLALGFAPENISGAIKTDKSHHIEKFLENARQHGFRPIIGDLAHTLPLDFTKYDIVSMDFRDSLSRNTVDVLEDVLLADRAIVMTNMQAKREEPNVSKMLIEYNDS